eukprot:snap_masked-scaffold_10-processed-gene-4.31-mRNA-1 protein AED:1.00 eAED:1.00 QI:0/0/0/0/1/1/2/0/77
MRKQTESNPLPTAIIVEYSSQRDGVELGEQVHSEGILIQAYEKQICVILAFIATVLFVRFGISSDDELVFFEYEYLA